MIKWLNLSPLKPLKDISKSKNFATFDCETKDGLKGQKLFCWALAIQERTKSRNRKGHIVSGNAMRCLADENDNLDNLFQFFQNRIEGVEKPQTLIVFVHNLGFDVRFLEDYCLRNNIPTQPLLSGSKMISYCIDSLRLKFIDSVQFLLCSQEQAEIEWNVDSELRKIDCSDLFEKDYSLWSDEDKCRVVKHNCNDVLALHSIMSQFRAYVYEVSSVDVLSVVSLASLSMKAFRVLMKKEEKDGILNPFIFKKWVKIEGKLRMVNEPDTDKYSFVKTSYFGGRTEVFNLNQFTDIKYIDRVSMYPAEMQCQYLPKGIPYWYSDWNEVYNMILDGKLGFVKATVIPSKMKYPVLPCYRDKRVCFTCEKQTGIFTTHELMYALDCGYEVVKMHKALMYEDKEKFFESYVDHFYQIKQNNKGGRKKVGKIFMNSLYGKFGESIDRKAPVFIYEDSVEEVIERLELEGLDMEDNPIEVKYSEEYKKYYYIYVKESRSMKNHQNIAIASFITSYARVSLCKLIHQLEKDGVEVIYCDTDSVSINGNSITFPLGRNLGDWDIEQSFDRVQFLAPKAYMIQNNVRNIGKVFKFKPKFRVKLKGCDRNKLKEYCNESRSMDELEVKLREPIQMLERYATFNQSLRYGYALNTRKLQKHFSFEFFKRKVKKDKTTVPWGY